MIAASNAYALLIFESLSNHLAHHAPGCCSLSLFSAIQVISS